MKIKRFASAKEMFSDCAEWLERDAAINNLLLGTLIGICALEENGTDFEAEMVSIADETEVKLAFLKIPSRELLMSVATVDLGNALEVAAAYFAQEFPNLDGVVGPEPMNTAFANAYGKAFRLGFAQKTMKTSEVNFPQPCPGNFRLAVNSDIELLTLWMQAFFLESLKKKISLENAKVKVREKLAEETLWVWENGEIVSMAGATRPTREGITISLVYTPEHLRGLRYASNNVACLTQLMLDTGKTFCCLHVDSANPISNKIYEAIGYQVIGNGSVLMFEND